MHDDDRSRAEPPAAVSSSLSELAATLKHDLGKYVAWLSFNLPEEAWRGDPSDALVDALRSDILETRRGPALIETAAQVFDRLTRAEPRPWRAPELARVAAAVEVLRAVEPAIQRRDGEVLRRERAAIRAAQTDIRRELVALHKRLAPGD